MSDILKRIPKLYHFTDVRNLPTIVKHGGLYPMTQLNKKGIEVPVPGGNEWSRDADGMKGMDGYVHLCFKPKHPMEFRARESGHLGETVFLQIDNAVLLWEGVLFTPGVSNRSDVEPCTVEDAMAMIDFQVLYERTDWTDAAVQTRLQQAEKYEILVPKKIPLTLIRNLPNG